MWSSTTNSIICTLGLVNTVLIRACITSLWWTAEPWYVSIDHANWMPPFPMSINLIIEPHISTTSDGHISCPFSIEIWFYHGVSSIDIGVSRYRHCAWNSPRISMCGGLTLGAWHTKSDALRETGFSKLWNWDLYTDWVLISETLGYWPTAGSWGWSWLLELERAVFWDWITIVLR